MPSSLHEGLIVPFRHRPGLTAELLSKLGFAPYLPATFEATVEDTTLTETAPAALHADLVVVLRDEALRPALAVVLEAQLQIDDRKAYSWPRYLISARSRYACPALVLVLTPSQAVADWARETLELGPGTMMQPVVVGPAQIPRVTSLEAARASPELALLSLLAARDAPLEVGLEIASVTERAIAELPEDLARQYFDLRRAGIPSALRQALEERMAATGYRYQSEFARRYVAEGEAKGREEGREELLPQLRGYVRRILGARFGPLPDWVLDRVAAADGEALDEWVKRSDDAASIQEVFEQ